MASIFQIFFIILRLNQKLLFFKTFKVPKMEQTTIVQLPILIYLFIIGFKEFQTFFLNFNKRPIIFNH